MTRQELVTDLSLTLDRLARVWNIPMSGREVSDTLLAVKERLEETRDRLERGQVTG